MVDINKLTVSIEAHEGLRLFPYSDNTGHITIGYGRNLATEGITDGEASYLLGNDIAVCIKEAQNQTWWPNVQDNDARSNALCECIFNLGLAKFNTFTETISALCAGDFDTASAELLNSLWAKQVGQRAEALAAMVKTGEF